MFGVLAADSSRMNAAGCVVLIARLLDDDCGFLQTVEDLAYPSSFPSSSSHKAWSKKPRSRSSVAGRLGSLATSVKF